jgi:V-type H+-transporting ATPase subunit E
MDDSAVQKQLDNMTSFIRREAEERANEILVLAEEEFTIEKAKIVQTQKLKLMKEYERKERQVDVHKKMFVCFFVFLSPVSIYSAILQCWDAT